MQALLEIDCIPVGMELFPAADDDQWTLIQRLIDDCDYYILIVGGRYGSLRFNLAASKKKKIKMRFFALLVLSIFFCFQSFAQNTQIVSGRVTEQFNLQPIPFALVQVIGTEHFALSDTSGYFEIKNVAVGRINLKVSATSYKPTFLSNL